MTSGDDFLALGAWEVLSLILALGGGIALVAAVVYLVVKLLDR